MSSIGERISDVRKARGYTQDQLAERMHVSRQAISHWENERALPDFESIKQLSQVLGYDFSSEDEGIAGSRFESNVSGADNPLSGDFSSENGETAGKRFEPETAGTGGLPPSDGSQRGRRGKWWSLAGAVCLLMVAVVAGWRFSKRAAAEVAVRPLSPVVYLTSLDEGAEGWAATFVFENGSAVPFLPDHVTALYYADGQLVNKDKVSYSELSRWMDGDKMRKEDTALQWTFSVNYGNLTRIECVLAGTDDNGHTLSARAEVELAKQYADGAQPLAARSLSAEVVDGTSESAAAEIAVRPLSSAAYLTTLDEGTEGWAATFAFENESDIPFLPDHVMALYYAGDRMENKIKIPYSELSQWMDGDKMCRGDTALQWTFNADDLNLTRIECVLQGTDDNGHKLSARASVELVKRYSEDAQSQETLGLPTFEDYKAQYARGLEETAAGQAYLNVQCTENPVRPSFLEEMGDTPMWMYTIHVEELCGAPFTVEKVQEAFFADGGHIDRMEYTAADLNWGDGVIGANAYKEWMGGLPVQSLVGSGITVSGVDANGNRQAFYGYVEFSNE